VITTEAVEAGQTPLLMVHTNVLFPGARLTATAEGLFAALNVAAPVVTDHVPEPTSGIFAANVTDVAQIEAFTPALAVVGGASTLTVTVLPGKRQLPDCTTRL
jgi:hypothetical protein